MSRPQSFPPEAVAAIDRGEIIQAIRLVRERTGLGLKESKDAVDRYMAEDRLPLAAVPRQAAGMTDSDSGFQSAGSGLPAGAIEALRQGNKMEAVKLVREAHPGLGLAQAKDFVEAYASGQSPSLAEGFAAKPSKSAISSDPMAEPGRVAGGQGRSALFWIAIVLIAVLGVWSLFKRL